MFCLALRIRYDSNSCETVREVSDCSCSETELCCIFQGAPMIMMDRAHTPNIMCRWQSPWSLGLTFHLLDGSWRDTLHMAGLWELLDYPFSLVIKGSLPLLSVLPPLLYTTFDLPESPSSSSSSSSHPTSILLTDSLDTHRARSVCAGFAPSHLSQTHAGI